MIESIISHLVNIVNGGMGAASIWRFTRVQLESVCKTISKTVDWLSHGEWCVSKTVVLGTVRE